MPWLDEFKLALISQNGKKLNLLIDTLPTFTQPQEMQEALALIEGALDFFENEKKEVSLEMQKIRDAKKYLLATILD